MRNRHFLVCYTKFHFLILCNKTLTKSFTNEFLRLVVRTFQIYNLPDNHDSVAPKKGCSEAQYICNKVIALNLSARGLISSVLSQNEN